MYAQLHCATRWLLWFLANDASLTSLALPPWYERPPLDEEEEDFEDEETRFIAQADWIEGAQAEVRQSRVAQEAHEETVARSWAGREVDSAF